jgi:hypothetical protein
MFSSSIHLPANDNILTPVFFNILYIYVCVYIYTYIYMCIYMCVYIYICICIANENEGQKSSLVSVVKLKMIPEIMRLNLLNKISPKSSNTTIYHVTFHNLVLIREI